MLRQQLGWHACIRTAAKDDGNSWRGGLLWHCSLPAPPPALGWLPCRAQTIPAVMRYTGCMPLWTLRLRRAEFLSRINHTAMSIRSVLLRGAILITSASLRVCLRSQGAFSSAPVVHVGILPAQTGVSRFGERGAPWRYSKVRSLAVSELSQPECLYKDP